MISARYNWSDHTVRISHGQLSALWSCDRSTVKRTLNRCRELGFIIDTWRGVRGQASCHFLNIDAILAHTRPVWVNVGSDVRERLAGYLDTIAVPNKQSSDVRSAPHLSAVGEKPLDKTSDVLDKPLLAALHRYEGVSIPALRNWLFDVDMDVTDHHVTLKAKSRFFADYIAKNYADKIARAMTMVDGQNRAVIVQ
jgi:hypothetical protein